MISKKDLLITMNISYGQLYRWKREELIPDEWFNKVAVPSGQETFFEEALIIPRIKKILDLKDRYSLEELQRMFMTEKKITGFNKMVLNQFIKDEILEFIDTKYNEEIKTETAVILMAIDKFYRDYPRVSLYRKAFENIINQEDIIIKDALLHIEFWDNKITSVALVHKPVFIYTNIGNWDKDLNDCYQELWQKVN